MITMKTGNLKRALFFLILLSSTTIFAQETVKLYDPTLDGMKQLNTAIAQAKAGGKHVLVQYGGNWCSWCRKFDAFCKADTTLSRIITDDYVAVKLNYSPENKNEAANKFLCNPMRFGFPVFIIIDGKGNIIHIQDSALLEDGPGYNKIKVKGFFENWTAAAIIPQPPKPKASK
jgi:thioredoxin-related protein